MESFPILSDPTGGRTVLVWGTLDPSSASQNMITESGWELFQLFLESWSASQQARPPAVKTPASLHSTPFSLKDFSLGFDFPYN